MSQFLNEDKGTKRVEIQIVMTLSCVLSEKFQVIYAGKTPACLPKAPDGWNKPYIPNHWSNEQTIISYS